jgi:hypothetical protein
MSDSRRDSDGVSPVVICLSTQDGARSVMLVMKLVP